MKLTKLFSLLVLMMSALVGFSQKHKLMISDSLRSRADELPVKMGSQWMGHISKFKFGQYGVGESKMGWGTTVQKAKIFSREAESSSKQRFSFEFLGPTTDVAQVNAVSHVDTRLLREWVLFCYTTKENLQLSVGEDEELLLEANNFTALLTINKDTTDIWSLIMTSFKGSKVNDQYKPVALLSNGMRKIDIVPVISSEDGDDKRKFPARGYELKENNKGLAALQFYGGGTMGMNKNIVWLPRDEDPKMKLLLAAALTTVLQYKMDNIDFFDPKDTSNK